MKHIFLMMAIALSVSSANAQNFLLGMAAGMAMSDSSSSTVVNKVIKRSGSNSCFIEVPYVGSHYNDIIQITLSTDSINWAYGEVVDGYINEKKKETRKVSGTKLNVIGSDKTWSLDMPYEEFKSLLKACEKSGVEATTQEKSVAKKGK